LRTPKNIRGNLAGSLGSAFKGVGNHAVVCSQFLPLHSEWIEESIGCIGQSLFDLAVAKSTS
jgi:hypothetical protein